MKIPANTSTDCVYLRDMKMLVNIIFEIEKKKKKLRFFFWLKKNVGGKKNRVHVFDFLNVYETFKQERQ